MGLFDFMSTRKTKRDYAQERLDPRWQKKRLDIMNRDSFACCDCGDENTTLNVHHRYYVTGRKPWEYPDWSFQTLCYPCHERHHEEESRECGDDDSKEEVWEDLVEIFSGTMGFNDIAYLREPVDRFLQAAQACDPWSRFGLRSLEKAILGIIPDLDKEKYERDNRERDERKKEVAR